MNKNRSFYLLFFWGLSSIILQNVALAHQFFTGKIKTKDYGTYETEISIHQHANIHFPRPTLETFFDQDEQVWLCQTLTRANLASLVLHLSRDGNMMETKPLELVGTLFHSQVVEKREDCTVAHIFTVQDKILVSSLHVTTLLPFLPQAKSFDFVVLDHSYYLLKNPLDVLAINTNKKGDLSVAIDNLFEPIAAENSVNFNVLEIELFSKNKPLNLNGRRSTLTLEQGQTFLK